MVITPYRTAGDNKELFFGNVLSSLFSKTDTSWQNSFEPTWWREGSAPFAGVLSFFIEESAATLIQVQSKVGEQPAFAVQDVAARLRAFHGWLDSLPPVPHISLEALDRDDLY